MFMTSCVTGIYFDFCLSKLESHPNNMFSELPTEILLYSYANSITFRGESLSSEEIFMGIIICCMTSCDAQEATDNVY